MITRQQMIKEMQALGFESTRSKTCEYFIKVSSDLESIVHKRFSNPMIAYRGLQA